MTQPAPRDFRQHLELETPEHVVLDYEIAGVGSRAAAALLDWILVFLLVLALSVGVGGLRLSGHLAAGWVKAVMILGTFAVVWGYFTLFEGLRDGQTPGKRRLGIRTIRDTGQGVSFAEAAARNLLLPVDIIGMIGIIMVAVHPRGRRLGDLVAGTVVVRDRPTLVQAAPAVAVAADEVELGAPLLDDEEFQLLRAFAARAETLPPAVRDRFATGLAGRFSRVRPARAASDLEFVTQLHADELARRRSRFGSRAAGSSRSVSERLVALKSRRWDEFQTLAVRVTAGGLDVLSAAELPDFATRYREVAADLARARTYRADPLVLTQLERLVAAGHAALYRDERQTWLRIWRFITRDCPAGVVQSWRYVAIAYAVFFIPAAAGFALLRAQPGLAPELIPDTMLERAEAGAARGGKGTGYVLVDGAARPAVASGIITNNVSVAFRCFAGGVVFGIGALVMVGYNGLLLGAIAGHFSNVGALGYLMTFVLGHGVLEISAICFAGAAGFMLGIAIVAPGDLKRGDALTLAGRRALRLVGAAFLMLLIAGTIEGFISTGEMTLRGRMIISISSAVLLAGYLALGSLAARREARVISTL